MVKKQALLSSLVLVATFATAQAEAQEMRENVPTVMRKAAPPPLPDQSGFIREFAAENKRMKRPRFVLFWNRDFSDEVVTYYIDYHARNYDRTSASISASQRNSAQINGRTWEGARVGASTTERASINGSGYSSDTVHHDGTVRLNKDEARKNLGEILNWQVEGSFKNTLIKGGTRLIDREMIIRTQGADASADEKINTHALETKAMVGKADVMIEILLAPSYESASGLSFKVNAVMIETGETIASVYTDAMPPVRETIQYEATSRGFEASTEVEGLNNQTIGEQLAINTMKELTSFWQMMAE